MSFLIDIVILLFSGWLINTFLGKNEHGIFGYFAIGLIGSIIGYFVIEGFVIKYIHPIAAKLIGTLIGALVFQLALNLYRREPKSKQTTQSQLS